MFDLHEVDVKITSTSTNAEKMGQTENTRLGMSVYFEVIASNEWLDKFDVQLRPALYQGAADGRQEDLTGHLVRPKFPFSAPLQWPLEGSGYTTIFHTNMEFNKPREIKDCKVDKFSFDIRKDGNVLYKFRIYFNPENKALVGVLAALQTHKVCVSLQPPEPSVEGEGGGAQSSEAADPNDTQDDLLSSTENSERPIDVLYDKAVSIVRAGCEPSSLHVELKISAVTAAGYISRMLDDGVLEEVEGEYVVVAEA